MAISSGHQSGDFRLPDQPEGQLLGRKGSNPVGFSASLLGFPGGATGLPMVGKGGLFWAGAGVGVWGEDGGQCRAWIRKAETVMWDSFKTRVFSGGSQKVLGSLGLPWRQGSACHREEGGGWGTGGSAQGRDLTHASSPSARQGIFENRTASPQSTASDRVFGSVGRWLESLPKALYPRAKEETAASTFSWDFPGL